MIYREELIDAIVEVLINEGVVKDLKGVAAIPVRQFKAGMTGLTMPGGGIRAGIKAAARATTYNNRNYGKSLRRASRVARATGGKVRQTSLRGLHGKHLTIGVTKGSRRINWGRHPLGKKKRA